MRHTSSILVLAASLSAAATGCGAEGDAPAPDVVWSREFDNDSIARVLDVALDDSGDTVVAGTYDETLVVDGLAMTSRGSFDAFVAKLDGSGNVSWARSFGSSTLDRALGVALDPEGNIWVTGDAGAGIDFGDGREVGTAPGSIFLAELDPDGRLLFGRAFGDGGVSGGTDVVIDEDRVYLTGSFGESVDFGSERLESAGSSDAFLARFDASGNCTTSRALGAPMDQAGLALSVTPNSELVLLVRLDGEVDLGGGPLVGGRASTFAAKFDDDLNHIWSAPAFSSAGAGAQDHTHAVIGAHSIAALAGDRTVLIGAGDTSVVPGANDFGGGPSRALLQIFGRYGDTLVEAPVGRGDEQDEGAITAELGGVTTVAGSFKGSLEFDDGAVVESAGGRDVYVAWFDPSGAYLSSAQFGDATHSEIAWSVAASEGDVVVGGWVRPNDATGRDRPLVLKLGR